MHGAGRLLRGTPRFSAIDGVNAYSRVARLQVRAMVSGRDALGAAPHRFGFRCPLATDVRRSPASGRPLKESHPLLSKLKCAVPRWPL